jgi:signal transduction histidine kinase
MFSSFKNISIRNKLIIIQATTAFVAVAICSVIFVRNAINTFKESSINNKYSIAQIVGANSTSALVFKDQETAKKLLANLSTNTSILNALILDKNGNVFAGYDKKGEEGYLFSKAERAEQLTYQKEDGKYVVSFKINQDNEFLGTVLIRSEYTYLKDVINLDIKIAILISLLALAVAILISFLLQSIISSRLLLLVSKAKEVTETRNYSTRVDEVSKDEIGILTHEFNNMMEQIEKRDKELEQRVKERTAELEASNRELESFSYSVSHDMRAPVRAVSGFTHILTTSYSSVLDEEGRQTLKMIDNQANRMGQLIDDLLDFSRLGKKEIQKNKVDMTALAKEAETEVLKAKEQTKIAEIIIDNLPPAFCDRNLIRQVFINLISNALKYSEPKPQPKIHIGSFLKNGKNIYFVKDNGVGFDMKYYNKLFGVFQRLHSQEEFKGTGIGLAIVQKIVIRHGGIIWAEATPNEGATFYFSL